MPIYSDLDYDLEKNEFGDIIPVEDTDAIRQSLRTIVLTKLGQKTRYQNPLFGSAAADLLFEKINPFTMTNLEDEIEFAVQNWEPRVQIESISVESVTDRQEIRIGIIYSVINLNITDELVINLSVLS